MKIFENKPDKPKSRRRKRYRGRSEKDKDAAGKSNLSMLHPMAFSLLSIKSEGSRPNEWVTDTFDVINNNPHRLSEKWIASINSWVDKSIADMMLDEPDIEIGVRHAFDSLCILKVIPAKNNVEYPMPAILLVDDRGWKWYFKTSKAYLFKAGDLICFTATVSAHKEGITFLKRPSKIRVADDEVSTS